MAEKALFKIDFSHFHAFVWSSPEKIIEDLKSLQDKGGAPLINIEESPITNQIEKISFICWDFQILEVGTDKTRL